MARIALVHDVAGVAAIQAHLLRQAGHEVDQISLPHFGASWSWPAKAIAIPIRLVGYLPAVSRLRSGRYDVIHIHWLTQGIVGLLVGAPFFVQAHGSDLHVNLQNRLLRWLTRRVLRKAKLVFYVTPNLLGYLAGFEEKARYLPNPVEVDVVAPDSRPPVGVANAVIFTRLDPVKGVEAIFAVADKLSRGLELTALDWGPLAHEYVERYRGLVRFVQPIPHDQIGSFLQRFDVVIGQMRQGILSLMEIEALATGRPLITAIDSSLYRDDPPPVIAVSGGDGIDVAIAQLKADHNRLAGLWSEGREWVRRNHGYARHLELLQASYFA
ncbi:MAG TPA: glycosyltransferase [Candidatus Dormibacteraeota bacterium]